MEKMLKAVKSKKRNVEAARKAKSYEDYCRLLELPPWPPRFETIASFLCQHACNNNGSTRSVSNVKSMLKKECAAKGFNWLGEAEEGLWKEILRDLRLEDYSVSRRKRPLLRKLIQAIIAKLDLRDPVQLYLAMLLEVGHNGLLRSGELLSGIKVIEVIWNSKRDGFKIFVRKTKAGKAVYVDYRMCGITCGVTLMKRWFDVHDLWGKMESPIFPAMTSQRKFDFSKTASLNWFRKRIKQAVLMIGLDPTQYSGHSLRAGGATDLFVARVPYYVIKKKGRWLSDAAMIYYRDEEDVEEAVFGAFSEMLLDY
jgi:hypothetical protein